MSERISHTMQSDQEAGSGDFLASGSGFEGADNLAEQLRRVQITQDVHKPRIGTPDHDDHVRRKEEEYGVSEDKDAPRWLIKAREGLAGIYANQAAKEAAATTADELVSHDPTDSPSGIPIRRAAVGVNQEPVSSTTANPNLVVRKVTTAPEPASPTNPSANESTVMIGPEGQVPPSSPEPDPGYKPESDESGGSSDGTTEPGDDKDKSEDTPPDITPETDKDQVSSNPESNNGSHERTYDYKGQKIIWRQNRADFLNSDTKTDEQKDTNLKIYQRNDQASIARGEVDEETLAELGLSEKSDQVDMKSETSVPETLGTSSGDETSTVGGEPSTPEGDAGAGSGYKPESDESGGSPDDTPPDNQSEVGTDAGSGYKPESDESGGSPDDTPEPGGNADGHEATPSDGNADGSEVTPPDNAPEDTDGHKDTPPDGDAGAGSGYKPESDESGGSPDDTPEPGGNADGHEATPPPDNQSSPEASGRESLWEQYARLGKKTLDDLGDTLGRAFREGMETVTSRLEKFYNLDSKDVKDWYQNWRHNGRRRSENYRKRLESHNHPDTKWQRTRLDRIERSEQRRAAFWDKWLGTRIGQEEEERPDGQQGRQQLVNQAEEGIDRATRLLANLRNDQERFRGLGLRRGREKVRQIEDDFRKLASQEAADKVAERLAETEGYKRAAKIIQDTLAKSHEDSHLDGEALEKHMEEVSQSVANKGEFRPMAHKAGAFINAYFASNHQDRVALESGIALLDTIKALSEAHDDGEIDDQTILRVNQLAFEGKNADEQITELSRGVTPAEIQAVAVGSILEIMQKVDQAQIETKSTRRKNDGKIHQFLASPGWKKTTGTIIAGAGTLGMIFSGPVGGVVAGAGIFMARQAGMRERVENKTNKKTGKQVDLIDRMTEDPLMREFYRRLDVTPQSQGGEIADLPSRGHIVRDDIENYNARELAEALGGDERRADVTSYIIDSMLSTSRDRARAKLMRRARSTAYSAGASTLPVGTTIAATGGLFAGTLMGLASVGVPLFGAWRNRKSYAPPA